MATISQSREPHDSEEATDNPDGADKTEAANQDKSAVYSVNSEIGAKSPTPGVDGRLKSNWEYTSFRILYPLTFVVGLTCVCLVAKWLGDYQGGFAWHSNVDLQFNYHPLFMVLGLVFLYGQAILVYRAFNTEKKFFLKIAHAVLHGGAFIFSVIALVAVFEYHELSAPTKPNVYSLHSWIGISAVSLFALQYAIGFVTFLIPNIPSAFRANLLPFHTFFGFVIFVMAVAACLTGITEKLIWSGNYSALPRSAVIANVLGIMLIIFCVLVIFIGTSNKFKRKPLPEEIGLVSSHRVQSKGQRTSL